MVSFNTKYFLSIAVLTLTVLVLGVMYSSRIVYYQFSWLYLIIIAYGFFVTPFLVFRFIVSYGYKPVPDTGYRPNVSVIIPVYNEEELIEKTIESIKASDYPKDKMEIIVVDDKSTDKSFEILSKIQGIKLLKNPQNMGKREAMALGVKNASNEILVCIDSDTTLASNAITLLVQPLKDQKTYCVCGSGIVVNNNSILTSLQRVWYADSFRIRKGVESQFGMVICCSGVLSAYRKDKFMAAMGTWLNEKFLNHEVVSGDDRQMTNLMMKTGGDSVFQSNAVAYTEAPHTLKKFVKQQLRWGRSAFRGMLFASKFFWKKGNAKKFVFYGTMFVNFVSPVSLLFNTLILLLLGQYQLVVIYVLGLTLLSFLFSINDKQLVDYFTNKGVFYRILFAGLSIVITFVYLYAWITPWKGKRWGTR